MGKCFLTAMSFQHNGICSVSVCSRVGGPPVINSQTLTQLLYLCHRTSWGLFMHKTISWRQNRCAFLEFQSALLGRPAWRNMLPLPSTSQFLYLPSSSDGRLWLITQMLLWPPLFLAVQRASGNHSYVQLEWPKWFWGHKTRCLPIPQTYQV